MPETHQERRLRIALRELQRAMGTEIRRQRQDAGLSQAAIARAVGIDHSHLCRIEAGTAEPSVRALLAIAAALGDDLFIRLYRNTGPRIRDHLQARMGECLLQALHPRGRATAEVAVYRPVHGVIDLVLEAGSAEPVIATEIHSQIPRVEQQVRWATQKADALAALPRWGAGDRAVSRLLVLRNTATMRELARTLPATFAAAYPARTAEAVASLMGAAPWPGGAIMWVDVRGSGSRLLERPPRGVTIGR